MSLAHYYPGSRERLRVCDQPRCGEAEIAPCPCAGCGVDCCAKHATCDCGQENPAHAVELAWARAIKNK